VDRNGIPLAVRLSPANRHDSHLLEAGINAVSAIRRSIGRPQRRLAKLPADKGHDFPQCRRALRRRAIRPL
jgi:hypothetical protein